MQLSVKFAKKTYALSYEHKFLKVLICSEPFLLFPKSCLKTMKIYHIKNKNLHFFVDNIQKLRYNILYDVLLINLLRGCFGGIYLTAY